MFYLPNCDIKQAEFTGLMLVPCENYMLHNMGTKSEQYCICQTRFGWGTAIGNVKHVWNHFDQFRFRVQGEVRGSVSKWDDLGFSSARSISFFAQTMYCWNYISNNSKFVYMCTLFLVCFLVPEDLSQNPSEEVNRGRKSSVDGSFPTFCRSSHSLHAPQKVCPLAFCVFFGNLQVVKNQAAVATSRGNGGFDGNSNLPATSTNGPNSMPWYVHDVFEFTGRFGSISKKMLFSTK